MPAPSNTRCLGCQRSLDKVALVLQFSTGELVGVEPHGTILLGRVQDSPAEKALRAFVKVSREHATVGVDSGGRAWVRDENSLNGTSVNDEELAARVSRQVRNGDTIRLGDQAIATVRLAAPASPGG